jgi:hypothetical protein
MCSGISSLNRASNNLHGQRRGQACSFPYTALRLVVLAVLLLGSFGRAMTGYDHNENTYVPQAVMLRQSKRMYTDFDYFQMPYLPHVYCAAFTLLGTTHYLLVAKTLTWIAFVIAGCFVFRIARLLADGRVAFAILVMFFVNAFTLRIVHECSNYVLPMTTSLAATWLLLTAERRTGSRSLLLFTSGLLASFSVGLKLYYVCAVLPLAPGAYCVASENGAAQGADRLRRGCRGLAAFLAGALLACAPIAFYMLRDWDRFWFNNFRLHRLMTRKFYELGYPLIELSSKCRWILKSFVGAPTISCIIVLALVGLAFIMKRRARRRAPIADDGRRERALSTSCVTVLPMGLSLAGMFCMSPMYSQYFAMPIPYMLFVLCWIYRAISPGQKAYMLLVAWAAVIVFFPLEYARNVVSAFDTAQWSGLRIHRTSEQIRGILDSESASGRLATLQPLFAVESGIPIYPQLCTGPFMYEVGDYLTPDERKRYVGTSPSDIQRLLGAEPPAAVLVGFYEIEDDPLKRYALRNGYREIRLANPCPCGSPELLLFVRPGKGLNGGAQG